ncbi:hypothetical protein A1F99_135450 [Pyrenophora tritici-repentis]|nr:hypothetical protein A1F99_135450 [Pyrenophora tritici-repentis]
MTITTLQVNAFLSRVSGQEGGVRGHMKRGDNGEAGKRNVFFVEVRVGVRNTRDVGAAGDKT